MPHRPILIFALLLVLVRFPLAQIIDDPSFTQTVDVQAYSGKKFRLSAAVKASPWVPQDYARLFYRLYTPEGQKIKSRSDTFSPRVNSDEWARYFVSGHLTSEVGLLEIGGMCYRGGEYFFDDFKLEIETAPGQWQDIPIANAGFEQWTDQGLPLAWGGTIHLVRNFAALPAAEKAYKGIYSLLLASSDEVDVLCKYEVLETYLPARLEHLTQEDGLPGSFVTSLHQDSRGFIWVGTRSGLARYDGHDFKAYQHDPADSTSISANDVTTIYEDREGGIWIGTISGGVNYFDPKNEQFERFTHDPGDPFSLGHNRVTAIFEGREGYIWTGGHHADGLNRLDRVTGHWKSYKKDSISPTPAERMLRLRSPWINAISEDAAGRLWLGSYSGLIYMDRKKEQFHQYATNTDWVHQSGTHHIISIYPAADGTIWVASERGLYHFNPDQREFTESFRQVKSTESGIMPNVFYGVSADSSGNLWLCWNGGISRFDPKAKMFYSYRLPDRSPQTTMVDREGLIWIGTDKGISILNPYKNQFNDERLASKLPSQLSTTEVNGPILEDSHQQLWASTKQGIFQVDITTGDYQLHTHPLHDSMSTNNNWVHALHEGHEQDIWISVSYNALIRWDRSTKQFTFIGTRGEKGVRETFRIFEDRLDTLWLSTWTGPWIYDRSENRYQKILWRSADGRGRTWTRVTYTTETKDGTIWMGTTFGELKRFDRANRRFQDFTPSWVDTKIQLNENTVTHIHEGPAGILWVSTMNNGFYRLDTSTRATTFFRQQHGLINNSVNKIMEDAEGRLWICTSGGLSRFDPVNELFWNFDINDGLPAIELGEAYLSQHTGIFYIGSEKGLIYFHPDSIRPNLKSPPVVFTALATYAPERGSFLPVPGISERDTVTLSHQDDLITVEFAALSYSKTGKRQYAYRLQGLNDEWIALGTKQEITLSNLPPGRYTLQVKGSNGDGVWNESGASLLLFITPPWYWSTGSKALYLVLFGVLLYWLYRFQLNRQLVRAEVKRLAELDTFKSRLYTNITHEFRTPLTVISGTAEQTIERAGDLPPVKRLSNARVIKRNSDQLLQLVNQMLDLRKLESGTLPLNLVNGDVLVYLKYLTESLHSLAEAKNISLQFEAEAPQIQMDYDPEKLESIIYNLLTNAIKFTPPGGGVKLLAQPLEQTVQIQIRDSGVGIPPEKLEHIFDRFYQADDAATRTAEGTGIGLALTRELVKLLGGTITVESRPEKGTTFRLYLPITQTADRTAQAIPATFDLPLPAAALPVLTSGDNNGKATDLPLLLVVEDNADVVSYLYDCLHDQYRLAFAQNGQVGIEKALETTPDLIVSDVMMPEKDGFELCHTLKADERTSHIPIVLLTAKADLESKLEGLQRGADVYLPKPFHKTELLIRIKNLLEVREQLRQYYLDLASDPAGVADAPQPVDKVEDQFVEKIRGIVETHLDDPTFSVAALCRQAAMSRSQLHRKIKALTGYSASRFIRFIRLAKAKNLLLETDFTISEIAYRTGFQDPVYFSRVFRKEFSAAPSGFRKQHS